MNAPTIEKKLIPNSSGANDKRAAEMETGNIAPLISFLETIDIIIKIIRMQVKSATINGEKWAYPNGVKSKYE